MVNLIWLTIALPLVGVLLNLFFGRRLGRTANGLIGSGTVVLAFVVGVLIFFQVSSLPEGGQTVHLWNWINIGEFNAAVSLLVDPLSMVMVLVITGVGSLIHIYAIGYMDHDKDVARFFTYLNLFVASMLILVLSDNYLGMYVGWELVGLCSYLLIGFWYYKPSAADAGKKAFIVNRVGDFGFALGVFLIWTTFGSLTFSEVFAAAPEATAGVLTAITALLFVGAIGKSAQVPLYVWLPDAMEGPTPVSALIHAATMVTAGVYMVVRSNVLYTLAPEVSLVVAFIGAITAIFAATMALTEMDLKRVLAYSTVSQLGYMVLAAGIGAYVAAIFHLVTHAFFKALLFMAAGSVMHATHDVIDMRRLGGLKDKMPQTYRTFMIGAAALAGFPLITAGFWSKDKILVKAFEANILLYGIGAFTALLTAFYTFRAFYMTFHGQPRDQKVYDHAHENPPVMTVPLWILAFFSLVGGFIGLPAKELNLPVPNLIENWLDPVLKAGKALAHGEAHHISMTTEIILIASSGVIALFGIWAAYYIYVKSPQIAENTAQRFKALHTLFYNKYGVDEFYDRMFVDTGRGMGKLFTRYIDKGLIDNILVDGTARLVGRLGGLASRWQTGHISSYVTAIFVGSVLMGVYFFLR